MLCAFAVVFAGMAASAQEWTTGEVTATLDGGTLTISGSGAMSNYQAVGSGSNAPWYSFRDDINKLVIDEGVTSIGEIAFYDLTKIESVVIPNSVTSIGVSAFDNCNGLTSVTISNNVTSIGDYAFQYANKLTSITIPSSVISIGDYAFRSCSGLTTVTSLNPTPPTVAANTFSNVKVADAILIVPQDAVGAYSSASIWKDFKIYTAWTLEGGLTATLVDGTLTISGNGAIPDYTLNGSPWKNSINSINNVVIQEGVTSIGQNAFADLYKMTSITIPNSMASIGSMAFYNCHALPSITIPSSVASIGDYAFQDCFALTSVTILRLTPPALGDDVFYNVTIADVTLNVLQNAVDAYSAADVWKDFGNMQPASIVPIAALFRANSSLPRISVRGRTLTVSNLQSSSAPIQLRVLDLRGRTVSSFNTAKSGAGTFSLSKIPAGRYLVEMRRSGARLETTAVMVR
jgi:hypothetical protein